VIADLSRELRGLRQEKGEADLADLDLQNEHALLRLRLLHVTEQRDQLRERCQRLTEKNKQLTERLAQSGTMKRAAKKGVKK
jgi:hypothetical protein